MNGAKPAVLVLPLAVAPRAAAAAAGLEPIG